MRKRTPSGKMWLTKTTSLNRKGVLSWKFYPSSLTLTTCGLLFEPYWHRRLLSDGQRKRQKPSALARAEVMTILLLFHASGYRDFKTFYTQYVMKHYAGAFPKLTSYSRFVELQREALIPLWCYLHTRFGDYTGRVVCGRDDFSRLPQLTDSTAPSLPRLRRAGQVQYGLVLWL